MRYIKTYEKIKQYKINDYVIIYDFYTPAKITEIDDNDDYPYFVEFIHKDGHFDARNGWVSVSDIRYCSNNLEDIEERLEEIKYNL